MAHMTVCPDDLRFTQDSIKSTFRRPHHNLRIDHAVNQIRKKLLSADDFPAVNVVKHGGILWSLDNRRLWVFRKARVTFIQVNLVSVDFSPRSEEFFRNLEPRLERFYSSPEYYPRVRRRSGVISVESPADARDESVAPKLARDRVKDIRKFNETERVGVSEPNTIFVAKRPPPVGATENRKYDIEGRIHGREAVAESGGRTVWEMLQVGMAIAGAGWGVLRFLHKFI